MITPRGGWFPPTESSVVAPPITGYVPGQPMYAVPVVVLAAPTRPTSVWSSFFKGLGCLILFCIPMPGWLILLWMACTTRARRGAF